MVEDNTWKPLRSEGISKENRHW